MSDAPANQTPPPAPEGFVNIEIDGVALVAPKGSSIIQVADKAGIPIPRFCYHNKLSVVASCRMCMVDIEKAPKPAPACATPVQDGMKVYTKTKRALDGQRNAMEFLLINHPLDCPVCDQGGDCELQDLAMGFGRSVGRFVEGKRSVADEDLGPLVASDMTRCIHCTRCVRVTSEIAGSYELGVMQRGDRSVIGTYVGRALETELSGNVIDVCPVGALTNKPFRFRARPWEMTARESVGYHDALGSNLWLHLKRGEILRCVPRDNQAINENWLSDRDRYSHAGLLAEDRLREPMVKDGDHWREADWNEALKRAAALLTAREGDEVGILVHPSTSSEEGALLAALARALGSGNIDHRIGVADLADAPVAEVFEVPLAEVENADAIVLIGSNPRHEAPILGHRIRKAWRNHGARIAAINLVDFDFHFDLEHKQIVRPGALVDAMLALAQAAGAETPGAPSNPVLDAAGAQAFVDLLRGAERGLILLGEGVATHPQGSWIRRLARALASATGAKLNVLPMGANAIDLARVGVLPSAHDAQQMLDEPRKAWLLHGIEPGLDFADVPRARAALADSDVVALVAYADEATRELAQVMLPIGMAPEIDGTWVNADGVAQACRASAKLPGEARAGWRVLRALSERLEVVDLDFVELGQWRERIERGAPAHGDGLAGREPAPAADFTSIVTRSIYSVDAVSRRAGPLQAHPLTRGAKAWLHAEDAERLGLADGDAVTLDAGDGRSARLPVEISPRVPQGAVWVESGYAATAAVAMTGLALTVTRA